MSSNSVTVVFDAVTPTRSVTGATYVFNPGSSQPLTVSVSFTSGSFAGDDQSQWFGTAASLATGGSFSLSASFPCTNCSALTRSSSDIDELAWDTPTSVGYSCSRSVTFGAFLAALTGGTLVAQIRPSSPETSIWKKSPGTPRRRQTSIISVFDIPNCWLTPQPDAFVKSIPARCFTREIASPLSSRPIAMAFCMFSTTVRAETGNC